MREPISMLGFYLGIIPLLAACSPTDGQSESIFEDVLCGVPESIDAADVSDTVASLLGEAVLLIEAERRAFREYQASYCEDCDFLYGLQAEFFASSNGFLRHVASDHPNDARAQCAWGDALLRKAAVGEGKFDRDLLIEARSVLTNALELGAPPSLRGQISQLIENVEYWVGRP